MSGPRLLLIGGGHAHLRVIMDAAERRWPGTITLLSPDPLQFYSGMVPGYLQGMYDVSDLAIDLAALSARARIRFIEGAAVSVDGDARTVQTDRGEIAFDQLSLDLGSVPAGLDLPGVRQHALSLRPMARAVELRARIDALADEAGGRPTRVVVVGAGAAGFEIALALHRRIELRGGEPRVVVLESSGRVLPGYSDRVLQVAPGVLERRGIRVATKATVTAIDEHGATLRSGSKVEGDVVVWATGAAPPPLLSRSSVPLSPRGYLAVDASLRARDGSSVWGAGDCVDVEDWDLPKAGVYAVREGPVLARNLRAAMTGSEPTRYSPQKSFLSLLNTADGRALLRWNLVVSHSRAAWWLKDRIDRGFVGRHRA